MAKDLPKSANRYIPVHRLWQILSTKRLYFLRNTKWDDPFEGFLVKRYCRVMGIDFALLNADKYFMCLTTKPERDHFWRNYTPNKDGVLVSFDLGVLLSGNGRIRCQMIKYPKKDQIQRLIRRIDAKKLSESDITGLFFMKRYAFADEEELRLMIREKAALSDEVSININPHRVITRVLFDPRMDHDTYKSHKEFIVDRFGHLNLRHSQLYNPQRSFPQKSGRTKRSSVRRTRRP